MHRAVLDTDIMSELFKQRDRNVANSAGQYLQEYGCYTFTTLSVMEVVSGLQQKQRVNEMAAFSKLVEKHELLTLNCESSFLAGKIYGDLEKKGQRIGTADTSIAAIAIDCGLQLVTGNTRHYQRIVELGYELDLCNWRNSNDSLARNKPIL